MLQVRQYCFKENQRKNSELKLPSAVEGELKLEETRDAEVERDT